MNDSVSKPKSNQNGDTEIIPTDVITYSPQEWQAKRDKLREQLERAANAGSSPTIARYILSCLSAIPIVGGGIGGVAGFWSEKEQANINDIFVAWMKLQEDELKEIGKTLFEVILRLDRGDPEVLKRIESPEYLSLIKKAFRDWSAAESEEKRVLIRNLLANAGASRQLSSDDVIRLFIGWIDKYSEAHFAVIKAVYNAKGITRMGIWIKIHGQQVREDSADADLFKLLTNDLSQGHVIRQHRETDYQGNFIRQSPGRRGGSPSNIYTSAFDNEKQYELTELGMQFVHYTMNEIVPKITTGSS